MVENLLELAERVLEVIMICFLIAVAVTASVMAN